jgi:hypothetical protein
MRTPVYRSFYPEFSVGKLNLGIFYLLAQCFPVREPHCKRRRSKHSIAVTTQVVGQLAVDDLDNSRQFAVGRSEPEIIGGIKPTTTETPLQTGG